MIRDVAESCSVFDHFRNEWSSCRKGSGILSGDEVAREGLTGIDLTPFWSRGNARSSDRHAQIKRSILFKVGLWVIASPISRALRISVGAILPVCSARMSIGAWLGQGARTGRRYADRKSTRLNSSHQIISYAVFCLKKKKT